MLTIEVLSYISEIGRYTDGTPYTAEILFVQAEAEDGSRMSHVANFPTAVMQFDDEIDEYVLIEAREEANDAAERLAERVRRAGYTSFDQLTPAYWVEVGPRYGSPAYEAFNMEAVYAELERRDVFETEGRI